MSPVICQTDLRRIKRPATASYWTAHLPQSGLAEASSGMGSGREDLNLRRSAPKAEALPGCATPRNKPEPSACRGQILGVKVLRCAQNSSPHDQSEAEQPIKGSMPSLPTPYFQQVLQLLPELPPGAWYLFSKGVQLSKRRRWALDLAPSTRPLSHLLLFLYYAVNHFLARPGRPWDSPSSATACSGSAR